MSIRYVRLCCVRLSFDKRMIFRWCLESLKRRIWRFAEATDYSGDLLITQDLGGIAATRATGG